MADVVEEFLSSYPEEIRTITKELRNMARHTMHGADEFLYYDTISFSLGNSPLERICYISPLQKHVTLGFLFGGELDDQDHLLKGVGKLARHIKVKTLAEAKNPALKKLVKAAWTNGADSVSRRKGQMRQRRALTRQRRALKKQQRAHTHRRIKRAPRSRRRR